MWALNGGDSLFESVSRDFKFPAFRLLNVENPGKTKNASDCEFSFEFSLVYKVSFLQAGVYT